MAATASVCDSQEQRLLAHLSDEPQDHLVPWLDRREVDEERLTTEQRQWRENGFVLLPGFLPRFLIEAYCRVREKLNIPGGWTSPTPYLQVPELRSICCFPPLQKMLCSLIGGPMGLHLNLTGWVSTERTWHQDDYLNPATVNSWYAAVWFALDEIHPDSGPFQYVPGSHRWPIVRQSRVKALLPISERDTPLWPIHAERIVTPLYEQKIARSGLPISSFLGSRGDVLIWHGRLVHRGSRAKVPGMRRPGLIAHYTELSHRPDLPHVAWTAGGSPLFLFNNALH